VSTTVQRVKLAYATRDVMQPKSRSFADHAPIPSEFAFAAIDPADHISLSTNRNPHLTWTEAPDGTNSFALICHDSTPSILGCRQAEVSEHADWSQ
jgi:phosphatidylethanolamine-binding protein (PEBP) family uncharacterized protein